MKQYQILKTIVGSQAHGLATEKSDIDYRGVFVIPTSELLKLGGNIKTTSWIEGNDDDTSWEIGHFLNMATHCNPTVLETFLAPIKDGFREGGSTEDDLEHNRLFLWGEELRSLFPCIWNSADVKNAFIGYGLNQRAKFFKNQDNRAPKYATAYLRTLYNAHELLTTGTFSVDMRGSPVYDTLVRFKAGHYTQGEVIDSCFYWETEVLKAFRANPDKKTEIEPINDFLLKVRKEFWE